jgi:hypothetical protein
MVPGFIVKKATPVGRGKRLPRDDAGRRDVEGLKPSTLGLGNVKRAFVG